MSYDRREKNASSGDSSRWIAAIARAEQELVKAAAMGRSMMMAKKLDQYDAEEILEELRQAQKIIEKAKDRAIGIWS